MPFSYTISSANKLVYIEIRDSTDLPELEKAAAEIASDRKFKAEYDVIFDAREMKYTPLAGDVKEVVKLVLQSKDTAKKQKDRFGRIGRFVIRYCQNGGALHNPKNRYLDQGV